MCVSVGNEKLLFPPFFFSFLLFDEPNLDGRKAETQADQKVFFPGASTERKRERERKQVDRQTFRSELSSLKEISLLKVEKLLAFLWENVFPSFFL